MTKKQEKILETALKLFSEEGYHAISTSKIAKVADVSEGLIFRHFGNKEGLLNEILNYGITIAKGYFEPIEQLKDPKEVIKAIIEIPFNINNEEKVFWRLLYTLKWQNHSYDRTAIQLMVKIASEAFDKLGYEDAESEANVLEMILDGAATMLLLKSDVPDKEKLLKSIKSKYNLN